MPLEQLKEYKGRNPKPTDFDKFWSDGLKEVAAVEPRAEIKKSEYDFKGFDTGYLFFDSVKNSRICAKYVRPKNADKNAKLPVMLLFHGYGGNSGDFFEKIAFAGQGYSVLAMDCRGQAGRSQDCNPVLGSTQSGFIMRGFDDPDATNMYFRNVYLDTVQLVKAAKSLPNADPNRIYAHGGSQGGGLTVACAALNGSDIKKAAPVYPFLADYLRIWEMDLCKDAYNDITAYIKTYAPRSEMQDAVWSKLGYIDIQHLAPRIKADIFWGIGLMDNICPPSSQFAAYNKITSKKRMIIYTNHGHEGLPEFNDLAATFFNN
jgi:cephalosporin-C deacetylase